ncbi:MAG: YybH family protein [Longimicrobiales bacterium]
MMHASAEEWNRGDLDGFLEDYLDSPETAFVGAEVSYGVDQIRARYLRSYWSTGRPEGLLRFENLRVRPLGSDYALAHGTYVLTDRDDGTEQSRGMFSLVLLRTSDGWRIIHDHSSES